MSEVSFLVELSLQTNDFTTFG